MNRDIAIVRGGGDVASGVIQKLHRAGFRVLVLETANPTSIRRTVCFSEAVYLGKITLEDSVAVLAKNKDEIIKAWAENKVPVAIDPNGDYINIIKPLIVVDAIIAKRNTGMNKNLAPITVAVGPGFVAGKDVDVVIESNRGHNLGRLIFEGMAEPNTKTPGKIEGVTWERVLYSPCEGTFKTQHNIGDIVQKGQVIAKVNDENVVSKIDGLLRGILRDNTYVTADFKVGDVDPRIDQPNNCYTISDKARAIGGGVLEAVLIEKREKYNAGNGLDAVKVGVEMNFFKLLKQTDKSKENIVFTIVSGNNAGSKALMSDGEIVFSNNENIDWNKIENAISENRNSRLITFEGDKIYADFMHQSNKVIICGAGHVSIAVIKMCRILDIPVTVIDDRLSFANSAAAAGADNVICEPFEDALSKIEGDKGTFFIIVTRGHRYDEICLENIIKKENAYIGMIGSKLRVEKVLNYLEEKGIEREKLGNVHTPIGLKIGAETPAEIAVSIMAEIIEVKNKEIGVETYTDELIQSMTDDKYNDIPKALVTIVSRKGSAPRKAGTKMAVLLDGTMIGTIGGGCVEAALRQSAFSVIDNKKCKLVNVDMTGREAEDEGMVCGGVVEVFIEPIL